MKIHIKGLSFLSLLTAFLGTSYIFCLKLQFKTQSLEATQVSTFLKSIRSRGILRLTSYRLCSLPLLYIPYALNYSPITKKTPRLELAHWPIITPSSARHTKILAFEILT